MRDVGDLIAALRNPGQLCYNPTDLSIDFPHGGSSLGLVRDIAVKPGYARKLVIAEELGNAVVEGIYSREAWALAAVMRGWDPQAAATIFPNSSVGAVTGERVIYAPEPNVNTGFRIGSKLTEKAVTLVFSPRDRKKHRTVIFRKAIPLVEDAAELQLRTNSDLELAAVFMVVPLTAGKHPVDVGIYDDLTL